MIVFEEELKKFHKSLEIDDAEKDIYEKNDEKNVVEVLLDVAKNDDGMGEQENEAWSVLIAAAFLPNLSIVQTAGRM